MPKVTLLQPHTHAGIARKEGDRIDVTDAQAAWLAEHHVIAAPQPRATTSNKPAPTQESTQ